MSAKKQAEPRLACDCWEEWSWEASSSWLVEGVRWRVGRGSMGVDSVMVLIFYVAGEAHFYLPVK